MADKKDTKDKSIEAAEKKKTGKNKYKYLLAEYENIWESGSSDDHDHAPEDEDRRFSAG